MIKRTARLPLVLAALAAAALAAGCGSSSSSSSSSDPGTSTAAGGKPAYEAPALADNPQPAPDFTLRNSLGKPVSLSQFRGKAVLLTFIYSHCPDVCPLIVGTLHSALEQLGGQASKAQVVAGRNPTTRSVPRPRPMDAGFSSGGGRAASATT